MPPFIPGRCAICNTDAALDSALHCPACADLLAKHHRIVEPPVADEDTQPLPARPAKLCPPRSEPAWKPGRVFTIEVDPQDYGAALALREMGYKLTAQMKDPRTGVVTSHVWAKILDEGC